VASAPLKRSPPEIIIPIVPRLVAVVELAFVGQILKVSTVGVAVLVLG
jgi:hypothetical protein